MRRNHPSFIYSINRLLASDPTLDRWRSGLRALLTAGIAAGVFLLLTRWLDLDYPLALAGIIVPMMSVVTLQDPGRRQQQVTMAWIPVVASGMLVLGTLVADSAWLSGGLFLLIIFVAFQARRFGARGTGLGTIAYQSFFYALLFKNPVDEAQWEPMFVFLGCAIAWVVHFWLVPERADGILRSELRAYRARIAALLHDLARRLERDAKGAARIDKGIDKQIGALNDQALALDARLAACTGDTARLRDQIVRCELALETVAAVARADAAAQPALAARVRALRDAVAAKRPADAADAPADETADAACWRMARAEQTLASLQPWHLPLPAPRDVGAPPQPKPAAKPAKNTAPWRDDTTRRALQACVSALGAMLAGAAISPEHWYWAVFAAFIVFTRAATVGQTLSGAWRQVLASGAGLCLGVLVAQLAELAGDSRAVELSLLFVFAALGFYAFRGLQNVYTVLLTAMLAMLYELMGMDSASLLLLRLAETVVGAVTAVLVARLILPVHTGDTSDDKSAALLRAASSLLGAAMKDGPPPPLVDAVRGLDRTLQALRQALGPVTGSDYPGSKDERRRHLDRLARVAYCVRHFYALVGTRLDRSAKMQAAVRVLRPRLDGVATMLESPVRPAQPGADLPGLAPVDRAGDGIEPMAGAALLMAEADDVLRVLQTELAAPRRH